MRPDEQVRKQIRAEIPSRTYRSFFDLERAVDERFGELSEEEKLQARARLFGVDTDFVRQLDSQSSHLPAHEIVEGQEEMWDESESAMDWLHRVRDEQDEARRKQDAVRLGTTPDALSRSTPEDLQSLRSDLERRRSADIERQIADAEEQRQRDEVEWDEEEHFKLVAHMNAADLRFQREAATPWWIKALAIAAAGLGFWIFLALTIADAFLGR